MATTAAATTAATTAVTADPSQPSQHSLLSLLQDPTHSTLIKQGAEAKVYKSVLTNVAPTLTLPGPPSSSSSIASSSSPLAASKPILLKYRFPKHYRHPFLSQSITIQRTVSEVRALVRCTKRGVNVPRVNLVDEKLGVIGLEWIEGRSVRELLGGGAEADELPDDGLQQQTQQLEEEQVEEVLNEHEQLHLMSLIGYQLAKMHSADVIHGDLTTSNMMMRNARPREARRLMQSSHSTLVDSLDSMRLTDGREIELLLIDFGLSQTSPSSEDKAVDLYVLERAFNSTHPHSEHLFKRVIESYGHNVDRLWNSGQWRVGIGGGGAGVRGGGGGGRKKQQDTEEATNTGSPWKEIRRKLDDVRSRGRKRSMVG